MPIINEQTQSQTTPAVFNAPIQLMTNLNEEQTLNHYKDSYLLAKTAVKFGNIGKIVGFVSAGIIGFLGLLLTLILVSTYRDAGVAFVVFLILVTIGVAIGALFYGLGIALTVLGKNLSSSLDSAVHGSPFLTDQQKAQMINIAP